MITVKHETEILTEHYDKLILSPGAKPFVPPITGLAEAKMFSLRNVPDLIKIMLDTRNKTSRRDWRRLHWLGNGRKLAKRGLEVTLVEKAPHVLPPLDEEMAAFVKAELSKNNVQVITGQSAVAFEEEGQVIRLEDGQTASDLTILSVGVQPENTLAVEAGVATGLRGGIVVDEHYQTNQPDIYAVGDAIVVKQQITQEDALIFSFSRQSPRTSSSGCDCWVREKSKEALGPPLCESLI